jgi:hypothetical protein
MRALASTTFALCAVPFLVSLVSVGCTTPEQDRPADAGAPSPLGSGYRLRQITPPKAGDMADGIPPNPLHPVQNQIVNVTGVSVVTVDTFDETMNGKSIGSLYIEDVGAWVGADGGAPGTAAAFAGIECYSTSYQPASLKVSPGDVIDLNGEYQDYLGPSGSTFTASQVLPELAKPTAVFRFEYNAPSPVVIDVNDLNVTDQAHYDKGARWLGMLVQVNNVSVTSPPTESSLRVSAPLTADTLNGASIDNELYDLKVTDYPTGTTFTSIVGVVTYFYDFHIAPRSAADLVVAKMGTGAMDSGVVDSGATDSGAADSGAADSGAGDAADAGD